MAAVYVIAIDRLLTDNNFNISPSVVLQRMKQQFDTNETLPSNLPAESRIKSRVSAQKTKLRKVNTLPSDN